MQRKLYYKWRCPLFSLLYFYILIYRQNAINLDFYVSCSEDDSVESLRWLPFLFEKFCFCFEKFCFCFAVLNVRLSWRERHKRSVALNIFADCCSLFFYRNCHSVSWKYEAIRFFLLSPSKLFVCFNSFCHFACAFVFSVRFVIFIELDCFKCDQRALCCRQ